MVHDDVTSELASKIVTMDDYEKAWRTATASAGLLGIATSSVLLALVEPGLTTAVMVITVAGVHVEARMHAIGARPPAEIANITRVVLTGIAVAGLLRLLGSVAWVLVGALAIAAVPLLRRGRRSTWP
jgi:hypothetical protein